MTCHGNACRITGPLWGKSTGYQRIPLTKGQWRGAFMFPVMSAWTNCLNKNMIWDVSTLIGHQCNSILYCLWAQGLSIVPPLSLQIYTQYQFTLEHIFSPALHMSMEGHIHQIFCIYHIHKNIHWNLIQAYVLVAISLWVIENVLCLT